MTDTNKVTYSSNKEDKESRGLGVDIAFYNDDRHGRTVALKFHGGMWITVPWRDLPDNIQWLFAEMSVGNANINVEEIPWLKDWQNGN